MVYLFPSHPTKLSAHDPSGTLCEAFSQRSYSDGFVSSQIWVVALVVEDGNIFTIQNARSGTYMNLTNGARFHVRLIVQSN